MLKNRSIHSIVCSMATSRSVDYFEVSPLLEASANAEAIYCASHDIEESFGHAVVPPQLKLCSSLILAYTSHTVTGMLLKGGKPELLGQIEEEITSIFVQTVGDEVVVSVGTNVGRLYSFVAFVEANRLVIPVPEADMEVFFEVFDSDLLPEASIQSIQLLSDDLWICFANGHLWRMHPHSVIPSVWRKGALKEMSVESLLKQKIQRYYINKLPENAQLLPVTHFAQPLGEEEAVAVMVYGGSGPTCAIYTSEKDSKPMQTSSGGALQTVVNLAWRGRPWQWSANNSPDEEEQPEEENSPFPSLHRRKIVELHSTCEYQDDPRVVQSAVAGHDKVAMADSLGRVAIWSLETNHIVRLHKGFRQAQCVWMGKNLVIYSPTRRVMQVYKNGDCLLSQQAGKDAVLLCDGYEAHFLDSNKIGTTVSNTNKLEIISLENKMNVSQNHAPLARRRSSLPVKPSARHLRRLQQLLTTDTVTYTKEDIETTFYGIESLEELTQALDLVATTNDSLDGFQRVALRHAEQQVESTTRDNPHVILLHQKIRFYKQILEAFDALKSFESTPHDGLDQILDNTTSNWAVEAEGWATTTVQVIGMEGLEPESGTKSHNDPVKLSSLCAAAVFVPDSEEIRFTDSTRSRQDILVQIFKPLLADAFSYQVVNAVLDALRIRGDKGYISKCFGEWFMTLGAEQIAERGLFASRSPMTRFLQDLCEQGRLPMLYEFCERGTDLVRTFMLAVICRNAVLKASSRSERVTYGNVSSSEIVDEWEQLIRKLRICLLVSLRLHGTRLGAAPLSIRNLQEEGVFSPYEWIARDQLMISHSNEEITSLEKICKMSNFSFDPFTKEGDDYTHFTMLQNSCVSAAISEAERSEYLVDFDDDSGTLLLFLKHYNEPTMLVAHRVLLLAAKWSEEPLHLAVLAEAVAALRAMDTQQENLSLAFSVRLEVWTTYFCPYYKAHLFGFADVHEISEEKVAPLLTNQTWLSSFGRLALPVLMMLGEVPWEDDLMTKFEPILSNTDVATWPEVKPDYIMTRLVKKCRKIESNAWDAHCVTMCGLLVSDDVASLVECVPGLYELFNSASLFTTVPPAAMATTKQTTFLRQAVIGFAMSYSGRAVDTFACLAEIEMLSKIWKFDVKLARSIFLLAMYELGKDRVVDELLTKCATDIDSTFFVSGGVDIVSRRLNGFLTGKSSKSGDMRSVIGLLDADLCEWIKNRASVSMPLVEDSNDEAPVGSTHLLSMRLLSLAASSKHVEQDIRKMIHSLVVLSGTLVKALEARK